MTGACGIQCTCLAQEVRSECVRELAEAFEEATRGAEAGVGGRQVAAEALAPARAATMRLK